MSVCGKCSVAVSNKECVSCVECKVFYHLSCTRLGSMEIWKKMGVRKQAKWKCDSCDSDTASTASHSDGEGPRVLECLKGMREELVSKIGEVNSNVELVKSELTGVNNRIDTFQDTLNKLSAENELRKEEFSKITAENKGLKVEMEGLRMQVRDLEQYSRKDNVEIVGIPYTKGENLYALLDGVARVMDIAFHKSDVSVVHRLPVTEARPNPAIIVKFIARECKSAWIGAARAARKRLTAAALHDNWQSTYIFVNDHLSPYYKVIMGRARRLLREKKLAMVWTRDCKIFARKRPDSPVVMLRTEHDLDRLIKAI